MSSVQWVSLFSSQEARVNSAYMAHIVSYSHIVESFIVMSHESYKLKSLKCSTASTQCNCNVQQQRCTAQQSNQNHYCTWFDLQYSIQYSTVQHGGILRLHRPLLNSPIKFLGASHCSTSLERRGILSDWPWLWLLDSCIRIIGWWLIILLFVMIVWFVQAKFQ